MKLRLPILLAAAVMACFTVSQSARAAEYTWLGVNTTDAPTANDPTVAEVHVAANWNPTLGGWAAVWSGTATNTMVFSGWTAPYKRALIQFDTLSLAGIRVDAGAVGYSLAVDKGGGSGIRNINFRTADGNPFKITANESFDIGVSTAQTVGKVTSWQYFNMFGATVLDVANGKTLNLYGGFGDDASNAAHSITVGSAAGFSGTVALHKAAASTLVSTWTINNGAEVAASVGNALGSGNITLNGTASKLTVNTATAGTYSMGGLFGNGIALLSVGDTGEMTSVGTDSNFTGTLSFSGKKLTLNGTGAANGTISILLADTALVFNSATSGTASGAISFTGAGEISVAQADTDITLTGSLTAGSLKKSGAGELILTKATNFTQGATVAQGTLTLDFTGVTSNIINAANTLTLSGGTLSLIGGAGVSSQSFASTLFADTTTSYLTMSTVGTSLTLNLGSITGTGSLLVKEHEGNFFLKSSTYTTEGMTIDQIRFLTTDQGYVKATVDSAGNIIAGSGGLDMLPASGALDTIDYQLLGSLTVTASEGARSLLIANNPNSSAIADNTLTLNSGVTLNIVTSLSGLLDHDYMITGGTLTAGSLSTSGAGKLIIASAATIGSISFTDNPVIEFAPPQNVTSTITGATTGTGTIIKSGDGTLALGAAVSAGTKLMLNGGALNFATGVLANNPKLNFNGGKLQWATGNTQDMSTYLSSAAVTGTDIKMDVGSNNVTFANAFAGGRTLSKYGSGELTLNAGFSGSAVTLNVFEGTWTMNHAPGAFVTASTITVENLAKIKLLKGPGTGGVNADSGTLTLKGGTGIVDFTTINDHHFGGKAINFIERVSTMVGGGTEIGWRWEGGASATAASVAINVAAEASGSRIDVSKITLTRYAAGFNIINVVGDGVDSTTDFTLSSQIVTFTPGNEAEGIEKKGAGSLLFTGTNSTANYLARLKVTEGSFIAGDGGANGRWGGDIEIGSTGLFAFNSNETWEHLRKLTGAGKLEQRGSGTVTLSGDATAFSGDVEIKAGGLKAGNATALGSGKITVKGGMLDFNANALSNTIMVNSGGISNLSASQVASKISVEASGAVNLSNTSGTLVDGFSSFKTTTVDGVINNIGGSLTMASSSLVIGTGSLGNTTIINFTNTSDSWSLGSLTLDFTQILSSLTGNSYEIAITNGLLAGDIVTDNTKITLDFGSADPDDYNYTVTSVNGGKITIEKGSATLLRILTGQTETYTTTTALDQYTDVQLDGTMNVQLAAAGTLVIKELRGTDTTATLDSNGTAVGSVIDLETEVSNRTYAGSITGPADIVKSGSKDLTIGGDVDLEGTYSDSSTGKGDLTVSGGTLTINGDLTAMDVLIEDTATGLALGADSTNSIEGSLELEGSTTLTLGAGSSTTAGELLATADNTVALGSNASLLIEEGGTYANSFTFADGTEAGGGGHLVIDGTTDSTFEKDLALGNYNELGVVAGATFEGTVTAGNNSSITIGDDATFEDAVTLGTDSELTVVGMADFQGAVTSTGANIQLGSGGASFGGIVSATGGSITAEGAVVANANVTLSSNAALTLDSGATWTQTGGLFTLDGATLGIVDGATGAGFDFTTGGLNFGTSGATLDFRMLANDSDVQSYSLSGAFNTAGLGADGKVTFKMLDTPTSWVDGYEYTLLTDTSLTGAFDFDQYFVLDAGLAAYQSYSFLVDGTTLKFTISSVPNLTWAGDTDGVWENNSTTNWVPTDYVDTSYVTFDDSGTTTDVIVKNTVIPGHITVTGTKNYTFTADSTLGGKISGAATVLEKLGTGVLTLNLANDFGGGTTIKGGSIVLGVTGALGTAGSITFDGGSLKYGTGATDDLGSRIKATTGNSAKIDINGNTVAWASAYTEGTAFEISDTAATKGSLTMTHQIGTAAANKATSLKIGSGTNVKFATLANGTNKGQLGSLSSDGAGAVFTDIHTGTELVLWDISNYSGSIVKDAASSSYLVFQGGNDASHRIALNINTSADTAAVILGNGLDGKTLYLSSLNGTGKIRADWTWPGDTTTGNRQIDLLMSENNSWGGGIIANAASLGNFTVGSSGATPYTLTLSGTSVAAANSTLKIANAIVDMTGAGGAWGSKIDIAAAGKLITSRTADLALSQLISGAGALEIKNGGTSKTTISGANSGFSGTTLVTSGVLAVGNNSALGTGAVTVQGGTLDFGTTFNIANNVTAKSGALANMGGQDASKVKIDAIGNVSLSGVAGAKVSALGQIKTGTADNVTYGRILNLSGPVSWTGSTPELLLSNNSMTTGGNQSIITFDAAASDKTLSMSKLNLNITGLALAQDAYTFAITDGTLGGNITVTDNNYSNITLMGTGLNLKFYYISDVTDGTITVAYKGSDGHLIIPQGDTLTFTDPSEMAPTVTDVTVHGTMFVKLTTPDDTLVIKNLAGQTGGNIDSTGTAAGTTIELNTTGGDLTYNGAINGPANISKTGDSDQTIGGAVNTGGDITVKEGALILNGGLVGNAATVESGAMLAFGEDSGNTLVDATLDDQATLALDDGSILILTGDLATDAGSSIDLGDAAWINLDKTTAINSAVTGDGTIGITNGTLSFTQGDLGNNSIALGTGGALDIGGTGHTVKTAGVTGSGNDIIGTGGTLELNLAQDTLFDSKLTGNGTLAKTGNNTLVLGTSSDNTNYSLDIRQGALTLSGKDTWKAKDLAMGNGTTLNLGNTSEPYSTSRVQSSGNMSFGSGTTINAYIDPTNSSPYLTSAGSIDFGNTPTTVNLYDQGKNSVVPSGDLLLTFAQSGSGITGTSGLQFNLAGYYANVYTNGTSFTLENGNRTLVLHAVRSTSNPFDQYAGTQNQAVGAGLMWNNGGYFSLPQGSQLYDLGDAIGNARAAGDSAGIARTLSSISGSAFTAILSAERSALMNHVSTVRSHATKLGVDQSVINDDMPYFHTWITGNGSYEKLDQSNDEAGFSLNTWGGTFGADIDVTDTFSLGFSFTAEYGKLKAESWDYASGDRDAYYASLYARLQQGKWSHLLAFTGGWSTVDQSRTVNYLGGGSYRTDYDTNATAYNVMYEGAYDFYLNQEKTTILQPLFNASISWLNADGFNERASHNATLKADDMDMTFGTIGVGARLIGEIGSNVLGRAALGELRVECVQDIGDTQSTANVGWIGYPGYTGEVYGSKVGKTGVQAGAGITLPVGNQGAIFGDANIDARSHATSVFGRLGYRYTF